MQADIASNGWLSPDGIVVYGLYREATPDSEGRRRLEVGINGYAPPAGARVIVKYNPAAPVKSFGGPVTVAPVTYSFWTSMTTRALDTGTA